MILELARDRPVDRPVARVVDARCKLVREQPAVDLEQLEGEHPDVVELLEEPADELLGLRLRCGDGRRPRAAQDAVAVHVLGEGPEAGLAVSAADGDDRQLAVEGHDLLGQLVLAELLVERHPTLTLPVVAEPPRLDERRQPRVGERAEPGRRDPEAREQLLLDQPVLPQLERQRRWQGRNGAGRLDRHVLELVRDDGRTGGELTECLWIVVRRDDELANLARRRIRRGIEEPELEPERKTCEAEHAPQLAAADAGDERHRHATLC